MSPGLDQALREYFRSQGVASPQRVDVVLGLLRLNTREALDAAELITGRAITVCPAAVPPWPPKPVQRAAEGSSEQVVRKVNLDLAGSASLRSATVPVLDRLRLASPGMTRTELVNRGLSNRDIRLWTKRGWLEWSKSA